MRFLSAPRFSEAEVSAALGGPVTFLGSGSFGDTWRLGDAAVKIIWDTTYPRERIDREVSGLRRVESDYVVQLRGTGTVDLAGEPRTTLTFEYVAGADILAATGAGQWPSNDQGIALLSGLLAGVQDLHQVNTVHRDIKPANIALRDGDWSRPVILDLGLAKAIDESTITQYPGHIGTLKYMAPEQLEGRRARKAADLFAVGVTVREVLTRRHPFYDTSVNYTIDQAIRQIEAGPIRLPRNLPTALGGLLDRLVSPVEHERGSAKSSLRRLDAVR